MPPGQRKEYMARINRVIDYIENNPGGDLSLENLATIANFSKFHFHRIFGAITGQPLNRFIMDVKLERAASKLCGSLHTPVTEIAFECGFSSSSVFSRKFREHFGSSPSVWRANNKSNYGKTNSKIGQLKSNNGKDDESTSYYFDDVTNQIIWRLKMSATMDVKVEIKETEEFEAAYLRHVGPYQGNEKLFTEMFDKLFKWAGARDLIKKDMKVFTVYHNDPNITEDSKLRMSVCISVPKGTETDGEIGKMTIPGGKYAVAHFELTPEEYGDAWNALYGEWFPNSGYQPDDRPCFELYLMDPNESPNGKHIVDIYAPVKPV